MTRRTIEELRALQDARGLGDVHLVEFDERGFTIAHTDAERAADESLEECALHRDLSLVRDFGEAPVPPGTYIALGDEETWRFEAMAWGDYGGLPPGYVRSCPRCGAEKAVQCHHDEGAVATVVMRAEQAEDLRRTSGLYDPLKLRCNICDREVEVGPGARLGRAGYTCAACIGAYIGEVNG